MIHCRIQSADVNYYEATQEKANPTIETAKSVPKSQWLVTELILFKNRGNIPLNSWVLI